MNDKNMIADAEQTFYAVMVNGAIVSPRYASPGLAEDMIKLLGEAQQSIAEVVPVTSDGKQILLG